jgi:uncharacterized membrane protein
LRGLDPAGIVLGLVAFLCSLTPSLLPRPWQVQGVVSGLTVSTAYPTGVVITWLGRRAGITHLSRSTRRRVWYGVGIFALVAVPFTVWLGAGWQNQLRHTVRMRGTGRYLYSGVFLIAAAVAVGLIGLARLAHGLYLAGARWLSRLFPPVAAKLLAALLVIVLALGVQKGVIYRGLVRYADNVSSAYDHGNDARVVPPTSWLRSGGPGSLLAWSSLGRRGRAFVSTGPTPADLERLTGRPAIEPIRAYAGRASASTLQRRADLVLGELKRAGAFDRAVLAVATATGSGGGGPTPGGPRE